MSQNIEAQIESGSRIEKQTINEAIELKNVDFQKDIFFLECTFNQSVDFSGSHFCGRVYFYKCTFEKEINFSWTTIEKYVQFAYSTFKGKCTLKYIHSLGLINFSNTIFNDSAKIDLFGSHFEKSINFTNAKIEAKNLKGKDIDFRENVRIIKHQCIKMNDKIMAMRFHEYEMNAVLENKNTKCSDKFILILNKIASKHGTNWLQALLFILAATLILFALYITIGVDNQPFQWGWQSMGSFIRAFSEGTKYFCVMLNPAHPLKDLDILQMNVLGYIIDLLSRVVISYGIYQLVISYQKYSRNI